MKKSKSTKKSLVFSALSVLMCCAMLAGSTFAWFTDSVTTAKNQIVAGNLDVELEYWNGTEYVDATNATLFDANAKWEPGAAQVAYLKINNAGSLALKYKFMVNVLGETKGKNVAGEDYKLSDYLMFGVAEGQETPFADRTAAVGAVQAAAGKIAAYSKEGNLDAGSDAEYVALVVYMPETVGNEANNKAGAVAAKINFGITLVATQDTVEADGFDNQYDAGAVYPVATSADLQEKMAIAQAGDTIVFAAGSYKIDSNQAIPAGVKLVGTIDETGAPASTIDVSKTLAVTNDNISISNMIFRDTTGWIDVAVRTQDTATGAIAENLEITNCKFDLQRNTIGLKLFGGTIKDCTFTGGFRGIGTGYANNDVLIENCTFNGATYGIHFDGGDGNHTVTIRNSTVNGWSSFGATVNALVIDNCKFGTSKGQAYLRPYCNTTITNTTFSDNFQLNSKGVGTTITVTNCVTVSGDKVTKAMVNIDDVCIQNTWIFDGEVADFTA